MHTFQHQSRLFSSSGSDAPIAHKLSDLHAVTPCKDARLYAHCVTKIGAVTPRGVHRLFERVRKDDHYYDERKRSWGFNSFFQPLDALDNYAQPFATINDALTYVLNTATRFVNRDDIPYDPIERYNDDFYQYDQVDAAPLCVYAHCYRGVNGDVAPPSERAEKRRLGELLDCAYERLERLERLQSTEVLEVATRLKLVRAAPCAACNSVINQTRRRISYGWNPQSNEASVERITCPVCGVKVILTSDADVELARTDLARALADFEAAPETVICVFGGWANVPDK